MRLRRLRITVIFCLFFCLVFVSNIAAAADKSVPQVDGGAAGKSIKKVDGGEFHSIALQSDGTVWTWGNNWYGQLGDGTKENRVTPVQVKNLTDVVDVAAGNWHSLALKSDGTVWAWGYNYYGQLGDGSTIDRDTPVQVQGLDSVVAIAAGSFFNLALKSDGTVWAWGSNDGSQLGDWTDIDRHTPVKMIEQDSVGHYLDSVVAVAAGDQFSLALKKDGTVWAWGLNGSGQIGTGNLYEPMSLTQVPNLKSVSAVVAGIDQCLALENDGTVWEWGGAQESDGSMGYVADPPFQVHNLNSVAAIATAYNHNVALKEDGTVWEWGYHQQLGDENAAPPVQVQGLGSIVSIATGYDHTLALKSDGTLWAWGENEYGQLGNGTTSERDVLVDVPVQVHLNHTDSFQLSDSKSNVNGGSHNEYSLYYGYISSPGQELSGSWSPPKGFHGTITVSMISPKGKNYDLNLDILGDGSQSNEETKENQDGTEFSKTEVPEGYTAEWKVKGHTDEDYSQEKVFVYVNAQYNDN
ncbi:RCC1 domain-containing protein [Paenibacillus humicola]|uniref:RCC1 domain-containing protein n=1 Tax=Paenibacillus humicola TaxID=3110540 RepID=UPI00237A295A|nr:hypothetical protein [Paenibacillus humicola]